MVIIGSGLDPLISAQVFEQSMDTLDSDGVHLKPPTPLGSRWPGVAKFYQHIFALPDSTGDNIILVPASDASSVDVLNLDSGNVKMLSKLSRQGRHKLQDNTPLSSTELVHFFAIDGTDRSKFVWRRFDNQTLTQAANVTDIKESYICSLGKTSSGERIIVNHTDCQVPIKWNIRTGFVNGTSVVLVDEQNAVYIFDRRVFTSGKPADVVKIPAEKFWTEWQPPSNSSKPGWFRGKCVTWLFSLRPVLTLDSSPLRTDAPTGLSHLHRHRHHHRRIHHLQLHQAGSEQLLPATPTSGRRKRRRTAAGAPSRRPARSAALPEVPSPVPALQEAGSIRQGQAEEALSQGLGQLPELGLPSERPQVGRSRPWIPEPIFPSEDDGQVREEETSQHQRLPWKPPRRRRPLRRHTALEEGTLNGQDRQPDHQEGSSQGLTEGQDPQEQDPTTTEDSAAHFG